MKYKANTAFFSSHVFDLSEFDRLVPGEVQLDSAPDPEEPQNSLPLLDREARTSRRPSYRWRTN